MSISIGRLVLPDSCGIEDLSWRGSRLTVSLTVAADTEAEMVALRHALLGFENNRHEDVVPFVWTDTDDTRVTGYYRINSVDTSADAGTYVGYMFPVRLDMERVGGAEVRWESHLRGGLAPNTNSITAGTELHRWSRPPLVSYATDTVLAQLASHEAAAELTSLPTPIVDCGSIAEPLISVRDADLPDTRVRWRTAPSVASCGAVTVEMRDAVGDAWFPVIGTDRSTQFGNTVGSPVRLSNGLTRWTFTDGLEFTVEAFSQSLSTGAWSTFTADGAVVGGGEFDMTTARVVYNAPHRVTLAFGYVCNGGSDKINGDLYVTLGRGKPYIVGYVDGLLAPSDPYYARFNDADFAGSNVVGGVVQAQPDAGSGHKLWVASRDYDTRSTAISNQNVTADAAATSWSFAYGVEFASGNWMSTAQDQIYEYHSTLTESVRVTT